MLFRVQNLTDNPTMRSDPHDPLASFRTWAAASSRSFPRWLLKTRCAIERLSSMHVLLTHGVHVENFPQISAFHDRVNIQNAGCRFPTGSPSISGDQHIQSGPDGKARLQWYM
ncbi:hypothetical protein PHSY_004103 [Pseudozyma hubeiensis SY62]|uniref:Uncharacterized protein n=1 Tax=Pseudozyma hubeiensis (strain SY62) TaxID=1305764 RepID=R9P503_PSEHS|nr:hypothetical protein PHSY_004103 [Pseudozyma hubeiensis SY62]GAC96523.1 hypothetical protein PHSY_004103 [Pseudozyma hubeiensis SY62]